MKLTTLIGYEYKKMFRKKSVVICSLLLLPFLLITGALMLTGNVYVEDEFAYSHAELIQAEREAGEAMKGTLITGERLFEAAKQMNQMMMEEERTAATELERQKKYMKDALLVNLLSMNQTENLEGKTSIPYYEQRKERMEASWETAKLSEEQIQYLKEQDRKTEQPWNYAYNTAYQRFAALEISNIMVLCIFFVICLSSIFAEEYTTRVDALLLSTKYGRKATFAAKILTGLSFAMGVSVVCFLAIWLEQVLIYGWGDASAPMQITSYVLQNSPYAFTTGEMMLMVFAAGIVAALFFAIIIMILSAAMKSAFGPAVICLILTFLPLITMMIPDTWKVLSTIRNILPGNFGSYNYLLSDHTLQIGKLCFPVYQYVPVVYAILTVAALLFAARTYLRRQPA